MGEILFKEEYYPLPIRWNEFLGKVMSTLLQRKYLYRFLIFDSYAFQQRFWKRGILIESNSNF